MPGWIQTIIILIAVMVSVIYLVRRMKSAMKGEDSFDCPFAEQCDGCSCQKPELKDKCGIAKGAKSNECGCGCD